MLCDKVSYNMPWWAGVSDDAKDFVDSLLQRCAVVGRARAVCCVCCLLYLACCKIPVPLPTLALLLSHTIWYNTQAQHALTPCRDPEKRPSAKEALKHPWLQGNSSERSAGKQIDLSVVQRIQVRPLGVRVGGGKGKLQLCGTRYKTHVTAAAAL